MTRCEWPASKLYQDCSTIFTTHGQLEVGGVSLLDALRESRHRVLEKGEFLVNTDQSREEKSRRTESGGVKSRGLWQLGTFACLDEVMAYIVASATELSPRRYFQKASVDPVERVR